MKRCIAILAATVLVSGIGRSVSRGATQATDAPALPSLADQAPNTWVKRSPLPGGPPSPRLGYESSWAYDVRHKRMVRWGAHDPGGGGPQLTETWTFDPVTCRWAFMRTNNNPPGNCCCRENVYDPLNGVFTRFSYPAFGHGWYWDRSRFLREDSVWTYDLGTNTWTNLRPGKEPALNVGKPAFHDPNHQMIWVYDTKLRAYDPYTNTWHSVNQSPEIRKRTYAGMALDPERHKIVLFGDHYQSDPRTWVYDIATDRWTDMKPTVAPPGIRSCPTMVYDSLNKKMILLTLAGPLDSPGPKAALKVDVDRNKAAAFAVQVADVELKVRDALRKKDTFLSQLEFKQIQDLVVAVREGQEVRLKDVAVLGWADSDENPRRMETWTYDLGTNTWTKVNPPVEPDYSGTRGRLMRYLPDHNLVILEGRTSSEQQVWTYRYASPSKSTDVFPPPPSDVGVETQSDGVAVVSWRANAGSTVVAGYRVYRGEGDDRPWRITFKRLTDVDSRTSRFEDRGLKPGTVYYYYVTMRLPDGRESRPSLKARTQPRVLRKSRVDVLAADRVVFSWEPASEADLAGYVVERAVLRPISGAQKIRTAGQYVDDVALTAMVEKAALGPFERLTPKPIAETTFTDPVDLRRKVEIKQIYWQPWFGGGKGPEGSPKVYDMSRPGCPFTIYAYRVRVVNRLGIESGPSPYQMTVPNEVEGLFSKEDGTNVHLRWQASPHRGIGGYLVYRLDGRYGAKVRLLTPKPITETTFTDTAVGGQSRRYYVVVVDALGQQGLPSHGAWGFRPWRAHYAPWVPEDGWHQ